MSGYLHVYTGNGKGKTTAALGLTIRAAGAGMKVFFCQFVKGRRYSETAGLERYADLVTVRQFGRDCFIRHEPEPADIEAARQGLAEAAAALADPRNNLVVLDEAAIALHYHLFTCRELLDALEARHKDCEVVVTGRYASATLIDAADLVTEMNEIKHYFNRGVPARDGIER